MPGQFETINLEQRSEEWIDWRRQGIGASDIAVLVGSNLYTTPHELWQKKCGFKEDPVPNFAMRQGSKVEGRALKWVNKNLELDLVPTCVMHKEKPEFRASLDGYDLSREIVCEIKCPISAGVQRSAHLYNKVPEYWLDQVLWQAYITQCKKAFIAVWNLKKNNCTIIDVLINPERQMQMVAAASDFWQSVKFGNPPNLTEKDVIQFRDADLEDLLDEYDFVVTQARETEKTRRELREQIVPYLTNGKKFKVGRFKLFKQSLGKRYNIGQMKLDGIDVEKYVIQNKKDAFALKVSCVNDKKKPL